MRKRLLLLVLCFAMVIGNLTGLTLPTDAAASSKEEVSYLDGSDLLYDLMETATTFLVAQHKVLGGSHYAYTEGLFEESTGEAASGVGTEMNFASPSRLVLLTLEKDGDKVKKTEKVVLNSTTGCIRDVDVSADGTKAIFSWKQKPADDFHIYEMELTSGKYEYKQLTFGSGVADFECIYLPNGEILFQSSRAVQTVDCWKTPVSNIYKMAADGTNIVRLGYDQVHTTYPTLTSDGRVIYTRWDYNDRTQMWVQGMFQMNPDGTNQTELYGNNSNFPTTLVHTREVMGEDTLYVSIATGHHTYQAGKLCLVDVSTNRDGAASVTFPFPDGTHSKNDNIDAYGQSGALYMYPYAISKSQFLVSYCASGWASDKRSTPFALYLMDSTTKEKICLMDADTKYPASQIVPVKTRDMFVRPSMVDYKKTTGTYYVGDVYLGEAMEGVARGTIKQIRVVALDYRAYAVGATVASESGSSDPYTPIATGNGSWDVKVVLGVATVYEDGSALFTVPSETPVYFQLLDKDGNMIQTMRSWSTLMPGEIYSCVGCHEDNNTVPPAAAGVTMALKAGVETLKPDAWQKGDEGYDPYTSKIGFDYLEEVQPILDAKCISCHNNKNASYNKINATGMKESGVSVTVTGKEEKIFGRQETWEYYKSSTNNPAAGWNNTGFTGNWSTGKAGFGNRGDVAPVGTEWSGENTWIFVRKTFTIDDLSKFKGAAIKLDTFYDDTPVFYLNGQEIYSNGTNWVDNFTTVLIDGKSGLLKEGENVLAISINQHVGGCYIDCGLSFVIPDASDTTAANPFSLAGDGIGSQRMSRYFPLSYLVLTGSTPSGGIQWVGKANNSYVKWLSSMSAPEVQKPASFGALVSNLTKMFQNGAKHAGVSLTDTEYRTLAAWIDLCVPAYGKYDANNHWDATEMREAEEEQNKRDYYTMQNEYARMSIAGTLPQGDITVSYKVKSTGKTHTLTARAIANLLYNGKIRQGDTVTVTLPEGVKYFGFALSPKQGESIIYCPDGTFTYTVPVLSSLATSISRYTSYANSACYITARILTDAELAAKRNLAENTYDYTNNSSIKSTITGQYPHVSASSEWENNKGSGETDFLARNAIDGFKNPYGHGTYPVQSWGPANTGTAAQWLNIDFGRAVKVDELGIVVRYDRGHDTWFKQATVEVTYEDGTKGTQKINIAWTGYEQIIELDFDKPITSLKLKSFAVDQAGGWAALTEVAVYGTEVIK